MSFRATIAECLKREERVTVHFWWDGAPRCWHVRTLEPLPPERDTFLVEAAHRYVDRARLFRLPRKVAEELAAEVPTDRYGFEVHDALTRALKRPADHFGRYAYTDRRAWWENPALERERAAHVARCLANVDDTPHELPPLGWQERLGTARPDNDNAALLEQVGMYVDEAGRYHVTPTEPGLEHWLEALRALEHGPTYLNGVPVTRLACSPMRFRVALYELTAEAGLGCGARIRREVVMSLWEAARFIRAGRCPHHKYSAPADRWTETA
jgi:hypothetical protein